MKEGASCSSASVGDDVGFLLEPAPNDHSALLVEFFHDGALLSKRRNDPLARISRGRCSVVGNVIEDRRVLLVADGTDDRCCCFGYRPNESFVTEGQKILDAPATASDHDDVDVCARIKFLKSLSYLPHRVDPLHGDFANLEVGGGPAIPSVDHDIVLGVAVAAADQTDTTREKRKWLLAFWGEQSLGGQGCLELGEPCEEFSDTDGTDRTGAQLQTAATSPEFRPSPDHNARSGLQWWVEPADELGIGDDRQRGIGFDVSQGQELHARLRAGTEVGHLAFDPDGAQLAYPVAEHL